MREPDYDAAVKHLTRIVEKNLRYDTVAPVLHDAWNAAFPDHPLISNYDAFLRLTLLAQEVLNDMNRDKRLMLNFAHEALILGLFAAMTMTLRPPNTSREDIVTGRVPFPERHFLNPPNNPENA